MDGWPAGRAADCTRLFDWQPVCRLLSLPIALLMSPHMPANSSQDALTFCGPCIAACREKIVHYKANAAGHTVDSIAERLIKLLNDHQLHDACIMLHHAAISAAERAHAVEG